METKKSKKKIKVWQIAIIIVLIIAILYVEVRIFAKLFNNNTSNEVILDYKVATDELMEKYYGKKYVKELEENREKEEKEILSKYYEPESTATNIVENGSSIFQTDINEFFVQVVPDEDIPIAKSEEQWYLDLIDIYYNKPITEEDKYYIAERLEIFYRDLSKKNGYEELKGKIEAILIENNLVMN